MRRIESAFSAGMSIHLSAPFRWSTLAMHPNKHKSWKTTEQELGLGSGPPLELAGVWGLGAGVDQGCLELGLLSTVWEIP